MTQNINDNEATSLAQTQKIATYLLAGNSITQMDALRMFGCFRLASCINDLRNEGYDIATERVVTPSGKRVASYRMRGGAGMSVKVIYSGRPIEEVVHEVHEVNVRECSYCGAPMSESDVNDYGSLCESCYMKEYYGEEE